jgi:hypothetical protein
LNPLSLLYPLHQLRLCFRLCRYFRLGPLNPFGPFGRCFPYCQLCRLNQLHP